MYYNEVKIGALLHDIGKLYQKAGKGEVVGGIEIKGAHPIISEKFIERFRNKFIAAGLDVDAIKEIVLRHHDADIAEAKPKYKHLCKLVSRADTISSYERAIRANEENEWEENKQHNNYETVPLTSIFSLMAQEKKVNIPAGYYNKAVIKASELCTVNSTANNKKFIERFSEMFDKVEETDANKLCSKIKALLEMFAWCYPSDSLREIPDVSLYDHLKTTSAIASIVYLELTSDDKYKKGMRASAKEAGQEFVAERVKDTECMALIKIGARNADKFIISANNGDNKADGVKHLARNQSHIKKSLLSLIRRVVKCENGCILGTINIINNDDTEYTLLVNRRDKERIFNTVKKHSVELAKSTGLKSYFDIAYVELGQKDLYAQCTHRVIQELNRVYNSKLSDGKEYNNDYLGLSAILTNEHCKWVSSAELFGGIGLTTADSELEEEITDKEFEAVQEFNKSTSGKTMALVKLGITNTNEIMQSLFKVDNAVLDKLTREYVKEQTLLKQLGSETTEIVESDYSGEVYEYGSISRVSSAVLSLQRAIKYNPKEIQDTMYIVRKANDIVFVTSLDTVFSIIKEHTSFINKSTLGVAKVAVVMKTFKQSDDMEKVYNKVVQEYNSNKVDSESFMYNAISLTEKDFEQVELMISMVRASTTLNKSIVYSLMEYCSMYRDYVDNGNVASLMCIPRFFCKKTKNFTEKTITDNLNKFVTSEFTKAINGEEVSKLLYSLSSIIKDAISLDIRG